MQALAFTCSCKYLGIVSISICINLHGYDCLR
jgi:hypothetical protein